MDGMGCLVPVGHKDKGERLEQQDKGERLEQQDKGERLEQQDKGAWLEQPVFGGPLALGVVEWSTQGGGKLAAQMSYGLSWCMQGGLVEPITVIVEEQPTTSACLMIQITSAINPEFKATALCMEQSMRYLQANHSQLLITTMFPVLCAMLQRGQQSQ